MCVYIYIYYAYVHIRVDVHVHVHVNVHGYLCVCVHVYVFVLPESYTAAQSAKPIPFASQLKIMRGRWAQRIVDRPSGPCFASLPRAAIQSACSRPSAYTQTALQKIVATVLSVEAPSPKSINIRVLQHKPCDLFPGSYPPSIALVWTHVP